MRISDWSSDVCSSDLTVHRRDDRDRRLPAASHHIDVRRIEVRVAVHRRDRIRTDRRRGQVDHALAMRDQHLAVRSEEHTSELQSLMRISYAVFCLKKKKNHNIYNDTPPSGQHSTP